MSELRELYQEMILDHGRAPRNFGRIEDCTHHADGHNPLCGDTVNVFLIVKDGVVEDVRFRRPWLRHLDGVELPDDPRS